MKLSIRRLRQIIREEFMRNAQVIAEGRLFDHDDKTGEQSESVQGYIKTINANLEKLSFHKAMPYLQSAGFERAPKNMYDGHNYDPKNAVMQAPVYASETLDPHTPEDIEVIAYARKPDGETNYRNAYFVVGAVLRDPGNAKLHDNVPKSKKTAGEPNGGADAFRAAFDKKR